jgi:HSP20 family molecular chaperone IbpA
MQLTIISCYDKNDVDIEINKNTLRLRAEKKTEEEKSEDYLHR